MPTFDQWWKENEEKFSEHLDATGQPLYTNRDIAHAAWCYSALFMGKAVDQAVEQNLQEATRGL